MNTIDALTVRLRASVIELIAKKKIDLGSISTSINIPTSVVSHALSDDSIPNLKMISKINDAISGNLDFLKKTAPFQAIEDIINSETSAFYAYHEDKDSGILRIKLEATSDPDKVVKFLYVDMDYYNGTHLVAIRDRCISTLAKEIEGQCDGWRIEMFGDLAGYINSYDDCDDYLRVGIEE